MTFKPKAFLRADNGVAAIETAIILPFLMLLFFGMIDLTALISFNRKITYSASVVSDLVSQNRTNVLKTTVDDYYKAAEMIIAPTPAADFHVDVYGYRKVAGAVVQIWQTGKAGGPVCTTTPDTSAMPDLMTANNDVVVAIACMQYAPYVASFMGEAILGATTFNVEQAIMVRPRSTTTLTCYATTVGGAVCA